MIGCGKEAEIKGADPENIVSGKVSPDEKEDSHNESTPENRVPDTFSFEISPHVMPQAYEELYGSDLRDDFFSFCDAIWGLKDSFSCPTEERLQDILKVSRTCLPVADALIDRSSTHVSDGMCWIKYKVSNKDAESIISDFKEKVTETIRKAVPYDEPAPIKAMELLTAVAKKDRYDKEHTLSDMLNTSPYRAIMEDVGICQEISGEYIYYLMQVGIEAIPCSSLSEDNSVAHEWTLIQLDGRYYHIDPTYSVEYSDSLFFFCMTDKQREHYGDYPPERYTYGDTDVPDAGKYKATDNRFLKFWLAKSYEIDHEKQRIRITNNNTQEVEEIPFDLL
jgi:hypothetical protein